MPKQRADKRNALRTMSMRRHPNDYRVHRTQRHVHVAFSRPRSILSSAVLNGGLVSASHIVNLRVGKNAGGKERDFEPSAVTLRRHCREMGLAGDVVGLMTAAEMDSYRLARRLEEGVEAAAMVTAGISNAKRAGEPAECRQMDLHEPPEAGTINIILVTNALLTPAAMAEAIITATEAKSAALQNTGVRNPMTGAPATGTGTDSIVVAGGLGPVRIGYCGKHMLFGEMLAATVMEALTASLAAKQHG